MKAALAVLACALFLGPAAFAQDFESQNDALSTDQSSDQLSFVDRSYSSCAGELIGWCDSHDDNGNSTQPTHITCIARDAYNTKFTYTGSYGRPTSQNVAGAVANCRAHSPKPSSCHSTACRWANF